MIPLFTFSEEEKNHYSCTKMSLQPTTDRLPSTNRNIKFVEALCFDINVTRHYNQNLSKSSMPVQKNVAAEFKGYYANPA
jgi:hypothetical protein